MSLYLWGREAPRAPGGGGAAKEASLRKKDHTAPALTPTGSGTFSASAFRRSKARTPVRGEGFGEGFDNDERL